MIKILIVYEDEECSRGIEHLINKRDAGGTLNNKISAVHAKAWREPANLENVREADVVIAMYGDPRSGNLAELESLLENTRHAVGMLLTSTLLSTDDIVAAMRIGVRYAKSWPFKPAGEADFLQELQLIEKRKRTQGGREGRVLTFLSSQGGSGTTFVATQIAYACATRLGKKVLIIDADRQYADAQLFLTSELPATTLVDLAAQVDGMDAALFDASITRLGSNLDLLPGAGDPVKAAQIQVDSLTRILQFACPRYDMVIVDAGHHIDAAVMTLLDHSTAIFSVMRQSLPDLYSIKRLMSILQALSYSTDNMQIIINQFDASAKLRLEIVRDTLNIKKFHAFPRDAKAVQQASDQGVPLSVAAPRCSLVKAIETFVLQYFDEPQPSGMGRWWSAIRGASSRDIRSKTHEVRYN